MEWIKHLSILATTKVFIIFFPHTCRYLIVLFAGFCLQTEKKMESKKFTILAFVILISTTSHVDAGPLAYTACLAAAGGTACVSAASMCVLPPLVLSVPTITACLGAVMVGACGTSVLGCTAAFFAPTP